LSAAGHNKPIAAVQVIPKPGGAVLFVNGRYRGSQGVVHELLVDKYKAVVVLDTDAKVSDIYENICKLA
jgi:hypothetical protein